MLQNIITFLCLSLTLQGCCLKSKPQDPLPAGEAPMQVHLVEAHKFATSSGEAVTFSKINGKWWANVGDGSFNICLPVACAKDDNILFILTKLLKQKETSHKRKIHIVSVHNGKKYVFVGSLQSSMAVVNKAALKHLALVQAITKGDLISLTKLLESSMELGVDRVPGACYIALPCAPMGRWISKMNTNKGIDLNKLDQYGNTLLHIACTKGYVDIIKLLLEKGADLNKCDKDDYTPLHIAAQYGHAAVVTLLLEKGATFNKVEIYGDSLLTWAVKKGHIEVLRLLFAKGVAPNSVDKQGNTLLELAVKKEQVQVVRLLLEAGVDVDTVNARWKDRVLYWATQKGHLDVILLLLAKKVALNKADKYGNTLLHIACSKGHIEIINLLLAKGADPNKVDAYGNSPLHLVACNNGNVAVMTLLLSQGADPTKVNTYGDTFLHIMAKNKHFGGFVKIIKILEDKNAMLLNFLKETTPFYIDANILATVIDYSQGICWYLRNKDDKTIVDLLAGQIRQELLQVLPKYCN